MTILVVRHGETDGNAQRILQRADVPLNARGMRQAEQLARRLSGHGFVHILCSDLLRAQMTAAPIASLTGIAIEESPLLQERNFGDLRGTPYADLAEDPFGPDFAPPNGEDWPMFHARVADAFAFIVDRRRSVNGTLVVVTHGFVCRALVERHALLPARRRLAGAFRQYGRHRAARGCAARREPAQLHATSRDVGRHRPGRSPLAASHAGVTGYGRRCALASSVYDGGSHV